MCICLAVGIAKGEKGSDWNEPGYRSSQSNHQLGPGMSSSESLRDGVLRFCFH
jgi:hypothetical protein